MQLAFLLTCFRGREERDSALNDEDLLRKSRSPFFKSVMSLPARTRVSRPSSWGRDPRRAVVSLFRDTSSQVKFCTITEEM